MARIAVVVTHYRSPEELARSLDGLAQHPDLDVIVADSEVCAGTAEVIRRHYPSARHVAFADNVGYARLANVGIDHSDAPYLLVLNADVVAPAGTIHALADHMDANPDVAVVGPRVTYGDGRHQVTAFAFYRPFTILARRTALGNTPAGRKELQRFTLADVVGDAIAQGRELEADWLMGAALLMRRTAVRQVGRMEERYFLYFEDVDWCLRAWRAGWRVVYLPTVGMVHGWSRASKKGGAFALLTNKLARRHVTSAVLFFRLHGVRSSRLRRPELKPATVLAEAA